MKFRGLRVIAGLCLPFVGLCSAGFAQTRVSDQRSAPPPPLGQASSTADIFGWEPGYFHPFLGITEWYTDNVFNESDNEDSDFMTVFSPGIWFALPHSDQRLLDIQTLNVAQGGFAVSRLRERSPRRYQTYLLYEANYEWLARNSSESTFNHRAEGLFEYNMRRGFSVEVLDQFRKTHEPWATGLTEPEDLDKYYANLFDATVSYDRGGRLKGSVGYSNYRLDYTATRNGDRDRTDNVFTGEVSYRVEPKTSMFVQYKRVRVGYDRDAIPESDENRFYLGLDWDVTAKSRGRAKVGYEIKDFDGSGENKDLVAELQGQTFFTPRTSLRIVATRRVNETTIAETDSILSHTVYGQYAQELTTKIGFLLTGSYTNDLYQDDLTFGGKTDEREDAILTGGFSLEYDPRRWLHMSLGYEYASRDSNFNDFDYDKNTVFLMARAGL